MKRAVAAIVLLCRFACAQIEIDSDIGDTGAIADCIGNIQDEEWTEAEKWCEKAIEEFKEEGSTEIEGHLKLSLVLNKLGKHKKAKRMLKKAVKINPLDVRGHASLAMAHEREREFDAAVTAFSEASRLEPTNLKAKSGLASALTSAGKKEEAEVIFREVVKGTPDDAKSRFNLFMSLKSQEKFDDALIEIAETIRLAEAEGNLQIESAAHGNRGWVLQQLGRKEEAESEFSIAKEKKKAAQVKQEEEHRAYVNGEL